MTYIQVTHANPEVPCVPSWCLEYVQDGFGVENPPVTQPTATAAWNSAVRRHTDQNFPDGMWLPIWFKVSNDVRGHVAIREPNGSIWSSSSATSTWPVHHSSLSAMMSYWHGTLTYLGWTEDFEGIIIVKEEPMEVLNKGDIENVWADMYGRPPTQADFDYWLGRTFKDLTYNKLRIEFVNLRGQINNNVPTVLVNGKTYIPK